MDENYYHSVSCKFSQSSAKLCLLSPWCVIKLGLYTTARPLVIMVTRNRLGSSIGTNKMVQQNPSDLRYLLLVRRPTKNISEHAQLLVVAFLRNNYNPY